MGPWRGLHVVILWLISCGIIAGLPGDSNKQKMGRGRNDNLNN